MPKKNPAKRPAPLRDSGGRFKPGQSGNLRGRPPLIRGRELADIVASQISPTKLARGLVKQAYRGDPRILSQVVAMLETSEQKNAEASRGDLSRLSLQQLGVLRSLIAISEGLEVSPAELAADCLRLAIAHFRPGALASLIEFETCQAMRLLETGVLPDPPTPSDALERDSAPLEAIPGAIPEPDVSEQPEQVEQHATNEKPFIVVRSDMEDESPLTDGLIRHSVWRNHEYEN